MPAAFPALLLPEACAVAWLGGHKADRPISRCSCSVPKETVTLCRVSPISSVVFPFPKALSSVANGCCLIASMTVRCTRRDAKWREQKKKCLERGKKSSRSPLAFSVSCNREKKKQITNLGFGCGQSVILFCCIENLNAETSFLEIFTKGDLGYALAQMPCLKVFTSLIRKYVLTFFCKPCLIRHLTFHCIQQL